MGTAWRTRWAESFQIPPPAHPTYDLDLIVKMSLEEDLGPVGDVTTLATIPAATQAKATYVSKADGVFAGRGVAQVVIHTVDPSLKIAWRVDEGQEVRKGDVLGEVSGAAASILVAERLSLNFMQRMSGIATATKEMATKAAPARILETRKTVPGLRLLDKWAVIIGGGENHRMGLYDMVMIKDNHVSAAGSISAALERVDKYLADNGMDVPIECETRTLEEVDEVLAYLGGHQGTRLRRVMLDNMTKRDSSAPGGIDVTMLKEALRRIGGRIETEASGNVTLDTVGAIGATGVTFISSGALTHSVKAFDISLLIDQDNYREC